MNRIIEHPLFLKISSRVQGHFSIFCHLLLILACFPLIGNCLFLIVAHRQLQAVRQEVQEMLVLAKKGDKVRRRDIERRHLIQNADPLYLETAIESLPLLNAEMKELATVLQDEALRDNAFWQEGLHFLEHDNHFTFAVIDKKKNQAFDEVLLRQVNPVYANDEDVEIFLARIEGTQIGTHAPLPRRPDLKMTAFTMEKGQAGVWNIQCDIIRREQ